MLELKKAQFEPRWFDIVVGQAPRKDIGSKLSPADEEISPLRYDFLAVERMTYFLKAGGR